LGRIVGLPGKIEDRRSFPEEEERGECLSSGVRGVVVEEDVRTGRQEN